MRNPREVPVTIPRPSTVHRGDPAPWADRDTSTLDLDAVRARLAHVNPWRPEEELIDPAVRRSAVLVPLLDTDEVNLVLGKRSAHLPSHRGDLSFPGGRQQPEDADLLATALREAHEEMGMAPEKVEVLGELDHLGTMVTRFAIAPFAGVVHQSPGELVAQDGEVDRILVVPLQRLLEPGVYRQEIWSGVPATNALRGPEDPSVIRRGDPTYGPSGARRVNFFEVDEWDVIWGATATILLQFLDVVTST